MGIYGNMTKRTPQEAQSSKEHPYLSVHQITKEFNLSKQRKIKAVDKLSFSIHKGEFVTLIGPSGCGKSTTLRMIAGFIKPTGGDITQDGVSITHLGPDERNIPMVFQNYALFPHMSVFENIAYGLKSRNFPYDAIVHDVAMICQMLNLVGTESRFPNELSDGQQQRVALARALILKPKILLFDEPLSNLDVRLRIQTRAEIKRMQQILGITILYVTHDQGEALSLPDRILVMNKGRIVQEGTPKEVYNHPKTPFVADFIGNANFYDVTVLSIECEDILIAMHDLEFVVPLKNCDHTPITGEQLLLAINPISIALTEYAGIEGENQATGMVDQCLFGGHSFEYTISFSDTTIRVVQPNIQGVTPDFPEQSMVLMTFNPNSFHLFGTREYASV
jgi:iron(III) transport system ATP-binding protein